jgi:hypothetical protein
MTKIVPDFRAYCKQDNLASYNYLNQDYPIKLPTQTRDEPEDEGLPPQSSVLSSRSFRSRPRLW